jgi:hypothetical protein
MRRDESIQEDHVYVVVGEKPVRTAAKKRFAMITRSIKAWDMITADAVKKSFVKALK